MYKGIIVTTWGEGSVAQGVEVPHLRLIIPKLDLRPLAHALHPHGAGGVGRGLARSGMLERKREPLPDLSLLIIRADNTLTHLPFASPEPFRGSQGPPPQLGKDGCSTMLSHFPEKGTSQDSQASL